MITTPAIAIVYGEEHFTLRTFRWGWCGVPLPRYVDPDTGIPLAVAAEVAGVSRAAVIMWCSRDKVAVVGHTRTGERLYRYGDVLAAEAATRANPRRPRKLQPANETAA